MPSTPRTPLRLRLPLARAAQAGADAAQGLPAALRATSSRGAGSPPLALLDNVTLVQTWTLAPASRSAEAPAQGETPADQRLLALEAEDGSTVFIRADALAEQVARLHPQAVDDEGGVDLACFKAPQGESRGAATDWLWKRVSELKLTPDKITEDAGKKLAGWLVDKALGKLEDTVAAKGSTLGAKALMEAIEDDEKRPPGLYHWRGEPLETTDLRQKDDPRLGALANKPTLLFIHGTASHTLGSFGALPGSDDWHTLSAHYDGRIFGFEHRTFSQSPIDNALELAQTLPINATLHVVTHSRGGLVGDLLGLATDSKDMDALVTQFRRHPRPDEVERERQDKTQTLKKLREAYADQEQVKLRELLRLLKTKSIKVERYVRVACPAAGTALLSDNLDVFLSGLLELVRRGTSWTAGLAAGALGGPVAAETARRVFDQGLKMLSRVALEIANQRMQAQLVPGIEAMLPESPMGQLLALAPRQPGMAMALIAGDIEGGGVLKRIGLTFTDWMFFDRASNDLVVDTRSMYAGIARRGAHALFDQGEDVDHFSYFRNRRTRVALKGWLTNDVPQASGDFTDMTQTVPTPPAAVRGEQEAEPAPNTRPVLIYLPGIMGSNLEVNRLHPDEIGSGNRIWLDFTELPLGGLGRIAISQPDVDVDDVVDLAYGKLARHLAQSHHVIRFPFDWRKPIDTQATRLIDTVRDALIRHPDQPVRILAHSMGGLVTRYAFALQPELWDQVAARDGGRLLMLGTPNHGSHLMVETLLGRSDTIRLLARVDQTRSLQDVLDLVAAYPGSLQLLPQPAFEDTGNALTIPSQHFYQDKNWQDLAELNDDFWFGSRLGARPLQADLQTAQDFWDKLSDSQSGGARPLPHTDRIAYVFGQAGNTPCGLIRQKDGQGRDKGLALLGTPQGDGSVTWRSGKLDWLDADRCWLMPVDHVGLVNSPEFFDEIDALLSTGQARKLGRLPLVRGAAADVPAQAYQPGPPPGYPSDEELVSALVGGHARTPLPKVRRSELQVSVRADDLRQLGIPVMCGHYIGDPIAAAEWVIDRHLVANALSERVRLDVHAGPIGSASVVLMPRNQTDILRGTGKGALVVGLGEFGKLSIEGIRETVRAGVLRLLLHVAAREVEQATIQAHAKPTKSLQIASVLLGSNSTTHINVEESVMAVTMGVLEANRQYAEGSKDNPPMQVSALTFVEQYEDVAIAAARAVAELPTKQARRLQANGARVAAATELVYGDGVRQRLHGAAQSNYWPRLMVTDPGDDCNMTTAGPSAAPHGNTSSMPGDTPRFPSKLRYLYLSERARAEEDMHQSQPGLVDKLVASEIRSTHYNPDLGIGHTLFHQLVPLNLKPAARETNRLMLVLDAYTANLPWEMLVADDTPLVLSTRVVRQLTSTQYRRSVRSTRQLSAYLVYNPCTEGYYKVFGGNRPPVPEHKDHLPSLSGSIAEGQALQGLLQEARYAVSVPSGGESPRALDVISGLHKGPYRLLIISGHGMYQAIDRHGQTRSGVVLSDGLMLTAAEVSQMEMVPELVFLNCCHLGHHNVDPSQAPNKLAYGLARELIDMGVRCVVAAGWEVEDQAALTFSRTFFEAMLLKQETFGEAIFQARQACWKNHREQNTWGAYQAYGDPDFAFEQGSSTHEQDWAPVSPIELVEWLKARKLDANYASKQDRDYRALVSEVKDRLSHSPRAWSERADVQFALAELHAAYGNKGFEAACKAYQSAIMADTSTGVAPIKTIEQLANLESRRAFHLANAQADATPRDEAALKLAQDLVEKSIARLRHLHDLTAGLEQNANSERHGLQGSAYKRKAFIFHLQGKQWEDIRPCVEEARKAYLGGERPVDGPDFKPYSLLNRLQLDVILGQAPADLNDQLDLIQQTTQQQFAKHFEFWDGVASADAELTRVLHDSPALDTPSSVQNCAQRLERCYRDAVAQLQPQPRQFESVVDQLRILAELLTAQGDTRHLDEVLRLLTARLRGQEPPTASTPSATPSAPVSATAPASNASPPLTPAGSASIRPPARKGQGKSKSSDGA